MRWAGKRFTPAARTGQQKDGGEATTVAADQEPRLPMPRAVGRGQKDFAKRREDGKAAGLSGTPDNTESETSHEIIVTVTDGEVRVT